MILLAGDPLQNDTYTVYCTIGRKLSVYHCQVVSLHVVSVLTSWMAQPPNRNRFVYVSSCNLVSHTDDHQLIHSWPSRLHQGKPNTIYTASNHTGVLRASSLTPPL
jgi:hypothetical protein